MLAYAYGVLPCTHDISGAASTMNGIKCTTPVQRVLPCGHSRLVPCCSLLSYQGSDSPAFCSPSPSYRVQIVSSIKCTELVDIVHQCGRHMYIGECFESLQPRKCGLKCDRTLPCGHRCNLFCHEPVVPENPERQKSKEVATTSKIRKPVESFQGIRCPPCVRPVKAELPCGHEINVPCSKKEATLASYVCSEICTKVIICGHPCGKKCGESCLPCKVVVRKRRPGVCPHEVYAECFEDPYDIFCEELVPAYPPSTCGHTIHVPCGIGIRNTVHNRELLEICQAPCNSVLSCGHNCIGICSFCSQGRLHSRCEKPCGNILPCGHRCQAKCSEPCPPCQSDCSNVCIHHRCDLKCGDVCKDCMKPCNYKCYHGECTKACYEVCNKKICYEPCVELIPACGHMCVGFCGEPCPPYCFICDSDKLAEGNLFGVTPVPSHRYIYLPDCGHAIESESMDGWMNSKKDEQEITSVCCPLCRTVIRELKRYSLLIHNNRRDMLMIKKMTNGDPKENMMKRLDLLTTIRGTRDTIFINIRNLLTKFLTDKNKFYKAELECVAQYWYFITTTDQSIREIRNNLPKSRAHHLEILYAEVFQHLERRNIPLTKSEVQEFNREFLRVQHAAELQRRHGKDASEAVRVFTKTEKIRTKFDKIYNYLLQPIPYTPERERVFLENLQTYDKLINVKLNISEEEKMRILQAFGNQSGRWFKCKQGHVYVITECGGAVETGVCNECGEAIGGRQHRTDESNTLATEMDGAEQPLFPNSVPLIQIMDD